MHDADLCDRITLLEASVASLVSRIDGIRHRLEDVSDSWVTLDFHDQLRCRKKAGHEGPCARCECEDRRTALADEVRLLAGAADPYSSDDYYDGYNDALEAVIRKIEGV